MDGLSRSKYLPTNRWEWNALALACIGLLVFFSRDIRNQFYKVRAKLDEAADYASIERDVEEARNAAASLIPDIRQNSEVIAREQVEIEQLRRDVKVEQQEIDHNRKKILALRSNLGTASPRSPVGTKPMTNVEIRNDLRRRF